MVVPLASVSSVIAPAPCHPMPLVGAQDEGERKILDSGGRGDGGQIVGHRHGHVDIRAEFVRMAGGAGVAGRDCGGVHRDRVGLRRRASRIEGRHRERVGRVRRQVGDGIAGAGDGRDLVIVFEDRVAGDGAGAGYGRCVPTQDRGIAGGCGGDQAGRHGRNAMRRIDRSDEGPWLPGPAAVVSGIVALRPPIGSIDHAVFDRGHARRVDAVRRPSGRIAGNGAGDGGPGLSAADDAVVVSRIGALRPPVRFVGHAVFRHGHAGGVGAARRPRVRLAAGRDHRRIGRQRRRRRGRHRRGHRRAVQHAGPFGDRRGVPGDDVGQMQVVQRRVLKRVGLMIGRDRNDHRPVDLVDRELIGLKPAEIEYVGGGVELDVCASSPIPRDLGRCHGAPSWSMEFGRPAKISVSLVILLIAVNGAKAMGAALRRGLVLARRGLGQVLAPGGLRIPLCRKTL